MNYFITISLFMNIILQVRKGTIEPLRNQLHFIPKMPQVFPYSKLSFAGKADEKDPWVSICFFRDN